MTYEGSHPTRGATGSDRPRTCVGAGAQSALRAGPSDTPGGLVGRPVAPQAAVITWAVASGRCGAMTRPSGRSSPVSSKSRTPLHSRLHPCSGWCATRRADSRSGESAVGHGVWCWHMGGIFRSVVLGGMDVVSVPRLEASFMAGPRCDKSDGTQCCPTDVNPQVFRSTASHRFMTHHPRGRFIPTALSLRMVRGGRMGLVRTGRRPCPARTSHKVLVRAKRPAGIRARRRESPYERKGAEYGVVPRHPEFGNGVRGSRC